MSTTVSLFCLEDNGDSFCTQNKYLAQYGPQGEVARGVAGAGMAPSQPPTSRLKAQRTNEVSDLSWKQMSQQPVRNWVLIHNWKDQTCVLLKTTGVNSRSSIRVHGRHWEASKIYGMASLTYFQQPGPPSSILSGINYKRHSHPDRFCPPRENWPHLTLVMAWYHMCRRCWINLYWKDKWRNGTKGCSVEKRGCPCYKLQRLEMTSPNTP